MGKDQELLEAARSGNVTVVEKILGQRAKRSGPLARWVSPYQTLLFHASFPIFALCTAFHATPSISCVQCRRNSTKNCLDVCQFVMGGQSYVSTFLSYRCLRSSLLSMITCLHGYWLPFRSFPLISLPERFRLGNDHSRAGNCVFGVNGRGRVITRTGTCVQLPTLDWSLHFFSINPDSSPETRYSWTRVYYRLYR